MKILIFDLIIKLGKNIKYAKNPCKKCLVKITCDQYADCEEYQNTHVKFYKIWKDVKNECSELMFLGFLFSGFAFVILTVLFGLWKWVEILHSYFT